MPGCSHTVCLYALNLELVPRPELNDGPGREGGEHCDVGLATRPSPGRSVRAENLGIIFSATSSA